MDERSMDRAIDTASASLMRREPSGALTYNVMARVRDHAAPARRGVVWATAAGSVVLCSVIAILLIYQMPQTSPSPPRARPLAVAPPAVISTPPIMTADAAPTRRRTSTPVAREATSPALLVPDAPLISPIETEPIEVASLEVPQLTGEATSIENITIEPLTIEPLSASND